MKNIITIIGGMGPQASLDLHRRLLERAIVLGAKSGGEFPEIRHLSLPIDDFISDETKTSAALGLISSSLERLYLWRQRQYSCGVQYSAFTRTDA